MVVAVAKALEAGARASSAPRPATRRRRRRPTRRPPGSRASSSCRRARSRSASCSRRWSPGARVVAIDGNFDEALRIVRGARRAGRPSRTLVNSVNPFRLEGQKTGAFEVCDDLGRAPDVLAIPVGNAGNISAYWAGFREYAAAGASRRDARDVGLPGGRRRAARASATRRRTRRRSRRRSGSATRRRGRRPIAARDESGGRIEAVTDDEILAAYRDLARLEGVFCEPSSAAAVAGVPAARRRGRPRPATRWSSAS